MLTSYGRPTEENTSDRDITKQIRQAIEKDKTISTYGHNVRSSRRTECDTQGPVRSEEERSH